MLRVLELREELMSGEASMDWVEDPLTCLTAVVYDWEIWWCTGIQFRVDCPHALTLNPALPFTALAKKS